MDWLDVIPVEIPPQPDQDIEQNIPLVPTRRETNHNEIPQLESNLDEEEGQFEDLQTYPTHHNTYQESQNICKEYRKRLLDFDDDRYFREINHVYETYSPTRDHIPVNQAPGPCRMTGELIQTFGRGRGQARREAPTLWSMNTISAEQNTMQDKENSMHVTEICEYTIIVFCTTNSICP